MRIAIVEDDPQLLRAAQRTLGAGHTVEAFAHPADFLAAYAPGRYDAVVLDIALPQMSGVEVAKEVLGRIGPVPRVAFVTATSGELLDQARALGPVLPKPWTPEQLRDFVSRL